MDVRWKFACIRDLLYDALQGCLEALSSRMWLISRRRGSTQRLPS